MSTERKIIHIDMDAFYASVEQLDNPELKGKPVIVGGRPDSRGVVAACSYEARAFGVHSAMACSKAYRLCPEAVFIKPRMTRYKEISYKIMEIFRRYTEIIEPLSLDEAFLDITDNKRGQPSATLLAQEICRTIEHETGLTASAGVSCNKFIAKVASDLNKPNGISVIPPADITKFLADLPIRKFYGVGKVTEQKMFSLGIRTGADLKKYSCLELIEHFGKVGVFYYDIARGQDNRPVRAGRKRKSVGAERTFSDDLDNLDDVLLNLNKIACHIEEALSRHQVTGKTITLKVRYSDFTTITRSYTTRTGLSSKEEIFDFIPKLLQSTEARYRKIRLLGISISNLQAATEKKPRQLPLPFPEPIRPPVH